MRPGRMKTRLRLLRPVVTTDGFGSENTAYEEVKTIHAERRKMTGSYREELGEMFPGYTVEFNIRDAHKVAEQWRVEEAGGHLYTVCNIIPDRDNGMLTLRCERVNT